MLLEIFYTNFLIGFVLLKLNYVSMTSLELRDPPASTSASQAQELKV